MAEMRQRVPVARGGAQMRARPVQQQVRQQARQQVQQQQPQMQQLNQQQLATMLGAQEAACMTQPLNQTIFQKKMVVVSTPMNFIAQYESVEPIQVQMTPEIQYMTQPMSQVQLTSCNEAPVLAPLPCADPCEERPCATGGCSQGPYQAGAYAAAAAYGPAYAPALAPAYAPYASSYANYARY